MGRPGCLPRWPWQGAGFRPLVLERGPALDERVRAVERFAATGCLDENANIQFGEGARAPFSDGKLTTRIGDALCGQVTKTLLEHGAPPEIAWRQKPHVGTDLLRGSSGPSGPRSRRWAAGCCSTRRSPALR